MIFVKIMILLIAVVLLVFNKKIARFNLNAQIKWAKNPYIIELIERYGRDEALKILENDSNSFIVFNRIIIFMCSLVSFAVFLLLMLKIL